jgi:hypothetical protein
MKETVYIYSPTVAFRDTLIMRDNKCGVIPFMLAAVDTDGAIDRADAASWTSAVAGMAPTTVTPSQTFVRLALFLSRLHLDTELHK